MSCCASCLAFMHKENTSFLVGWTVNNYNDREVLQGRSRMYKDTLELSYNSSS